MARSFSFILSAKKYWEFKIECHGEINFYHYDISSLPSN